MKSLFTLFLAIITLFSCTQIDPKENFPKRVNLSGLKESAFSATFEHSLDSTKKYGLLLNFVVCLGRNKK